MEAECREIQVDGDARFRKHTITWEMIGDQIHYREEGEYSDGKSLGDDAQFFARPNGPPVKALRKTTFGPAGELFWLQVFDETMFWVNVGKKKDGRAAGFWMVTLRRGQLLITQITGGASERFYDRVE